MYALTYAQTINRGTRFQRVNYVVFGYEDDADKAAAWVKARQAEGDMEAYAAPVDQDHTYD